MSKQDHRYPPDQQFGARAARDQQRVDEAEDSKAQEQVAGQVAAKQPTLSHREW